MKPSTYSAFEASSLLRRPWLRAVAWHALALLVLLAVAALYLRADFLLLLVNQIMLCGS